MSKRNIIVSGADGNLGSAVVEYFLEQGDQVIGLVHHAKENPKDSPYEIHEIDLTDEAATEKLMKKLVKKHKTIDAAIMTTGGFAVGNLKKSSWEDLQKQYILNFKTAYNSARTLFLSMKENKKGQIFFIGSEPGLDTSKAKGVVGYALAKSQLFQLANIMNADAGNVLARVVVPTTIDTPQNRKSAPDADFSKWQKPKDIAALIGQYVDDPKQKKEVILVKEELKS